VIRQLADAGAGAGDPGVTLFLGILAFAASFLLAFLAWLWVRPGPARW
jgi:hypothetical protein